MAEAATETPVAGPSKPKDVVYCNVCGYPPEFCEFGSHLTRCKTWLEESHPDLYQKYYSEEALASKVGTLSLDKQQKLEKDMAKAEAKAEAKAVSEGKKRAAAKAGVIIKRIERQKRKYVTSITGLEAFGVDLKKAAKALAQRFATGASVSKLPAGGEEIVVQGDVADDVLELIEEAAEGGGNKASAVFKDVPADSLQFVNSRPTIMTKTLGPIFEATPAERAILIAAVESHRTQLAELRPRIDQATLVENRSRAALIAAQEAYDSAKTMLSFLKQHEEIIIKASNEASGRLHPIRRVPDEVLREVFLFAVDDATEFNLGPSTTTQELQHASHVPVIAAAVSQGWRRVAVNSSALWRQPVIIIDDMFAREDQSETFFNNVKDRSANGSIKLRVVVKDPRFISSSYFNEVAKFIDQVVEVRVDKFASEWACFHNDFVNDLLRLKAPGLRSVSLTGTWRESRVGYRGSSDPMVIINYEDTHAPAIETLTLHNWHTHVHQPKLPTVRRLDWKFSPNNDILLSEFSIITQYLPNLETVVIEVHCFAKERPANNNNVVVFPRVRNLRLVGRTYHDHALGRMRFPALTHVEVDISPAEPWTVTTYNLFDALHFLNSAVQAENRESQGRLIKLGLANMTIDSRASSYLRHNPLIEVLALRECVMHDSFINDLSTDLLIHEPPLVPKLHRLTLDTIKQQDESELAPEKVIETLQSRCGLLLEDTTRTVAQLTIDFCSNTPSFI
ncbi:hypothetical protein BKA62DRAFT_675241 [Auriculariales sp. MPI-PUGE-AT-0066]|nr:hypothetical protein BKA62DRAFT_675241 [Auriculariales sp. MPI-PUGE-AT-0066]